MKFVNIITNCYESITLSESSYVKSLNVPIEVVPCHNSDSQVPIVSNLSMTTNISIRGTGKEADSYENILSQDGSIDIIIRLTKCDIDENKRLYVDLDSFTIDLKEERQKGNIKRACFDYYNHIRVINIAKFQLPAGVGNYVLKVLIRKTGTENYSIQSMSSLCFKMKEDN